MAPELITFDEEDEEMERLHHTKASDVWAFGMVVYARVGVVMYFESDSLTLPQEAISGKL